MSLSPVTSQDIGTASAEAGLAYSSCVLCPRACGVNRLAGEKGFCGVGAAMRLALASIHFGEEPPLVGEGGSGTIFFSGCTLGCGFCQNYQISRETLGRDVGADEFAAICLALQDNGAVNVNLVTGTQFAPGIVEGLLLARSRGLKVPVLWNCSGYETVDTIRLLSRVVDIWLPDYKTADPAAASKWFGAPDYPETAPAAILAMAKDFGIEYGKDAEGGGGPGTGLLKRGLVMRHLVMPGRLDDSERVLSWFSENLSGWSLPSVMTQYTPLGARESPDRFLSGAEYEKLLAMLERLGLEDGFRQELVTDSGWLPDFTLPNPFRSALSRTVWHFETGFAGRQGADRQDAIPRGENS